MHLDLHAVPVKEVQFFYRDSLDAAWMARHFGMQYEYLLHGPVTYSFLHNDLSGGDGPFVIHPTSLHLLEPHHGDLVQLFVNMGGSHLGYWHDTGALRFTSSGFTIPMNAHNTYEVHRIIERNGIGFIWPEREE
jgi:hypothetical protein